MSSMPWFRMYFEARKDAKLRTLADDEFRVWFNLLCLAAENDEERGTVDCADPFILAIEVAGGDEKLLERTCHALSRLKILEQRDNVYVFVRFLVRQYDKPSDTPERTRERKQRSREKAQQPSEKPAQEVVRVRDVTPGHALDTDTEREERSAIALVRTPPRTRTPVRPPDEFMAVWSQYPNKSNRKRAIESWKRLRPDGELVQTMLSAIEAQKRGRQWREGFVPHFVTWLNQERWLDEPTEVLAVAQQFP
jgi:hypothetical protein